MKAVRALLVAALLAPGALSGPGGEEAGDWFSLREGRLDFQARDVPVADALAQLRHLLRRNIVVSPGVKTTFTGDLYGLTLKETLDAICRSTGLVWREEGAFIIVEAARVESRIFKLSYVRASELIPLLEPLMSPSGKMTATALSDTGIAASETDAGGDAYAASEVLLVADLGGNLERIAAAIRELDVRPVQVLIEATLISADIEDDRGVGVDWNYLEGIDFRTTGTDAPVGQPLDPGTIPLDRLDDSIATAGTALLDAFDPGGLTVGILKNSIAFFLRAVQDHTTVRVLANPRVMVLNRQRGQVVVGRRDGYLTTIVTETSSTQQVEFVETGTRLLFRPFVGNDGWIRLEIHPEDSDGGVNADGLPFKETTEVTTNILARDGQTIVIGGLFRERSKRARRDVPGVSRVPVLGRLFESNVDEAKREEVIILLTPRILDGREGEKQAAAAADAPRGPGARRLALAYAARARSLGAAGDWVGAARMLDAARRLDPDLPARHARGGRVTGVDDPQVAARVLVRALDGASSGGRGDVEEVDE